MAQWFYSEQGKTRGPVEEEQLIALLASGAVRKEDLVWREGMATWVPASQIPEFAQVPVSAPSFPAAPTSISPVPKVPLGAVEALRATRPWVRFLAVMGFIGCGLMALLGLILGMVPMGGFGDLPMLGRFAMAALYLLMAGVQLPPVIFLNRFASRIEDLQASGSPEDLEAALGMQKSFWRYVGILTLVVMCLYALVFVGGVLVVIALAIKH